MQLLALAPGASVGTDIALPASLSEMFTVPALKLFEGLAVVLEKLDQVAAATLTAASPQTSSVASSLRVRLIERGARRFGGSRRRSGLGSRSAGPRGARRSHGRQP